MECFNCCKIMEIEEVNMDGTCPYCNSTDVMVYEEEKTRAVDTINTFKKEHKEEPPRGVYNFRMEY